MRLHAWWADQRLNQDQSLKELKAFCYLSRTGSAIIFYGPLSSKKLRGFGHKQRSRCSVVPPPGSWLGSCSQNGKSSRFPSARKTSRHSSGCCLKTQGFIESKGTGCLSTCAPTGLHGSFCMSFFCGRMKKLAWKDPRLRFGEHPYRKKDSSTF